MYGAKELPIHITPMHPLSPYAISKASAWTVVNYRESYGLYSRNGVLLFNHESFKNQVFVKSG
jgi:GDPmannose 4,6-dehydratase